MKSLSPFATFAPTEADKTTISAISVTMPAAKVSQMQTVDSAPYATANHETIQTLHMDLMVFAISSGCEARCIGVVSPSAVMNSGPDGDGV